MTLADRLNQIIKEQKLTKKEFAARLSVTENYVYLLTGQSKNRPDTMARSLARLIALEFGYDEEWIITGNGKAKAAADNEYGDTCAMIKIRKQDKRE